MPRENEWDARWWSPIINAEHLAMRERAGIVDLTAFSIFDVADLLRLRPGSAHRVAVDVPRSAGSVYTPVLDDRGLRATCTVMRARPDDHPTAFTGGAARQPDRKGFADRMPATGSRR
jgi:glycine cleavage system aminomethyltransferase T